MRSNILKRDSSGKILSPMSDFAPSKAEKERIEEVMNDYNVGYQIMNQPYRFFGNRSPIKYQSDCQKAFNSYVEPVSDFDEDFWRANVVRPITRNKIISLAAHMTATLLYPNVFAQNEADDEDKDAASVMHDLMEWVIDNSDYARQYLYGIISALVSPAVIMSTDFAEVKMKIKEIKEDGKWTEKEVIDEVLSGFKTAIVPIKELFFANIYENNIQKQRFLIRRRYIDFFEAKAIYGDLTNFKYINPGKQHLYVATTDAFYEEEDEALQGRLVEEVKYYNRGKDLCLTFVNGILLDHPDKPNYRTDKLYPFAKSGFEPFDEGRFFYYKSCVDKMAGDQELVDTLYNMVMDGTFLSLMPPVALFGGEEVNSSVIIPGQMTQFREDTKLEPIKINSDVRAGLEGISVVERSLSESSEDPIRQGQASASGEKTAFEISRLEQNAKINLGLFGKMIGFFVTDVGYLLVGDILQHLTVGEIEEISDGDVKLKFKSFLIPDKIREGKKVTEKIIFDQDLDTENMEPEDVEEMEFGLINEEGGMKSDKRIRRVNPTVFRRVKFILRVSPDEITPKNKALIRALDLEAYDRMKQDAGVEPMAATDLLLETVRPGETDKYKRKEPMVPEMEGEMGKPSRGINQNLTGQLTGSNSLKNAMLQE